MDMATEHDKHGDNAIAAASHSAGHQPQARRNFLIAAGGTGLIGALAAIFGRGPEAAPVSSAVEQPAETPATSGYRETEHIRKYYNCARYF